MSIKELFSNKVVLIAVVFVILLGTLGVFRIASTKMNELDDSPIASLEARNDKTYTVTDKISPDDFSVTALKQNGKKIRLKSNQFALSRTSLRPIGNTTQVTLTYNDNTDVQLTLDVKVERKKVTEFKCGYPEENNVVAVLYSNGELCFEGKGDVQVFEDYDYPWKNYDAKEDTPIRSVTFEADVTPVNMDQWFKNNETLQYVYSVPHSVQSMIKTFEGCTALKKTPDLSNNNSLLNISSCFSGCTALESVSSLPTGIRTAEYAFEDCESLVTAPDMSKAVKLNKAEGMFMGDLKLSSITLPPSVVEIPSILKNCINLKSMPQIPNTVKDMDLAFAECLSLTSLNSIPPSVESMSSAFYDDAKINGVLTIDTNTDNYSSMFSGAVEATKLDLRGKSKYLDVYANSADNENITVNGSAPNKDKISVAAVDRMEEEATQSTEPTTE